MLVLDLGVGIDGAWLVFVERLEIRNLLGGVADVGADTFFRFGWVFVFLDLSLFLFAIFEIVHIFLELLKVLACFALRLPSISTLGSVALSSDLGFLLLSLLLFGR